MAQKARIKLVGYDINKMNEFIDEVRAITEKLGSGMYGPVPMPTNTLKLTTRKSPDGEGKGFERQGTLHASLRCFIIHALGEKSQAGQDFILAANAKVLPEEKPNRPYGFLR